MNLNWIQLEKAEPVGQFNWGDSLQKGNGDKEQKGKNQKDAKKDVRQYKR